LSDEKRVHPPLQGANEQRQRAEAPFSVPADFEFVKVEFLDVRSKNRYLFKDVTVDSIGISVGGIPSIFDVITRHLLVTRGAGSNAA
jgi:hypothetical protein